jgi:hypothetical protein
MRDWTDELVFIAAACVSACASASVLLTAMVFPSMTKRLFMRLIINISFCDLMGSIGSSFGFPSDTSDLCPVQSFLSTFSYKASWLWTVMLCHQLYAIIVYGKYGMRQWKMHLICWSIPLATTLAPLSNAEYGRDDDSTGWCFLKGGGRYWTSSWMIMTYMLVLLICLLIMVYFLSKIYLRFRGIDLADKYPDIAKILDAQKLYPISMMICWVPNLILATLMDFKIVTSDTNTVLRLYHIVSILATQYGTLLAIIFFTKSREARFRWTKLIFPNAIKDDDYLPLIESAAEGGDDPCSSNSNSYKSAKGLAVKYVREDMQATLSPSDYRHASGFSNLDRFSFNESAFLKKTLSGDDLEDMGAADFDTSYLCWSEPMTSPGRQSDIHMSRSTDPGDMRGFHQRQYSQVGHAVQVRVSSPGVNSLSGLSALMGLSGVGVGDVPGKHGPSHVNNVQNNGTHSAGPAGPVDSDTDDVDFKDAIEHPDP